MLLIFNAPIGLTSEPSALTPPDWLSGNARAGFEEYLQQEEERAFALSPDGAWGYGYRHSTLEEARKTALANCTNYATRCELIAENDRIIVPEYPFETAPASPQHQSPLGFMEALPFPAVVLMGITGLVVLLLGVRIARRYPVTYHFVFLPRTGEHYYLNWTLTPFSMVYLVFMSPLFHKAVTNGLTDIMSWTLFVTPLLLLALATLYLHSKGDLVHIHRQ